MRRVGWFHVHEGRLILHQASRARAECILPSTGDTYLPPQSVFESTASRRSKQPTDIRCYGTYYSTVPPSTRRDINMQLGITPSSLRLATAVNCTAIYESLSRVISPSTTLVQTIGWVSVATLAGHGLTDRTEQNRERSQGSGQAGSSFLIFYPPDNRPVGLFCLAGWVEPDNGASPAAAALGDAIHFGPQPRSNTYCSAHFAGLSQCSGPFSLSTLMEFAQRTWAVCQPICTTSIANPKGQTNRLGLGFPAIATEHRSNSMLRRPTNQTNKGRHGRALFCRRIPN
ncbi:hypothetical protein LZ32DRAFT_101792 [Colletotrichum eremochloae]|nr:hypothetical protein LZ32DRAFT_101792 [Colletotrichum eremochloae]